MVGIIDENKRLLGESPIWDERTETLYYVDILEKKLFCYFPFEERIEQHDFSEFISSIALKEDESRILVALESGVYDYCLAEKSLTFIIQPESKPNYRFNDGKVDSNGNWLLGSMNNLNNGPDATQASDATLYSINGNRINILLEGVAISNGIAFFKEYVYYVDTKLQNVRRFLYQNGVFSSPKVIHQFTGQDSPDGITCSVDGKLYIAIWGGSRIDIWDIKSNKLLEPIQLPCLNPTSCTFGGKEMNELFITSSSLGDDNWDLRGLYSIRLDDQGSFENKINWNLNKQF